MIHNNYVAARTTNLKRFLQEENTMHQRYFGTSSNGENAKTTEEDIQAIIDNQLKDVPKITYGTEPPEGLKNGELYFQIE